MIWLILLVAYLPKLAPDSANPKATFWQSTYAFKKDYHFASARAKKLYKTMWIFFYDTLCRRTAKEIEENAWDVIIDPFLRDSPYEKMNIKRISFDEWFPEAPRD